MIKRIKDCKTLKELYSLRREIVLNDKTNYKDNKEFYRWKLDKLANNK